MPYPPVLAALTTTVGADTLGLGVPAARVSDQGYRAIARATATAGGRVMAAMGDAFIVRPSSQPVAFMASIAGALPGGKRLARPLVVLVEYADGEVVVSETLFHMHAAGPTEREAMEAFRRVFAEYLPFLEEREADLGVHLRNQLAYLRSAIALA